MNFPRQTLESSLCLFSKRNFVSINTRGVRNFPQTVGFSKNAFRRSCRRLLGDLQTGWRFLRHLATLKFISSTPFVFLFQSPREAVVLVSLWNRL